ncbi:hypothetical protein ASPZODRAFT_58078 [Penicilliopsis zonata CBS 506.65]|uniref:Cytochrome P450 n=1 Tax=Penicilliopsis zonata CBS 506.65 TaxID=1073090 RepID=A0A1L9STB5_9EURO|nr:hypothetical protein ASPZODRAFT_58078 [Penicilliopsis zonata CBS 506.65]OJJ50317.1 hypothetical protein ASPZODRAFT_58078 [Penicilliopsis zonata CBS 506.65]
MLSIIVSILCVAVIFFFRRRERLPREIPLCPPSHLGRDVRLRHWNETVPNDGLLRFRDTGVELLLVTKPSILHEILVGRAVEFVKPQVVRDRLYPTTGNGLLFAEGDEHKMQRKALNPAFSYRHVKDLYPIFWRKAFQLVKCLEKESETGEIVTIRPWARRTTLDIIGVAGMDHDFGALHEPDNYLVKQYETMHVDPSRGEAIFGYLLSFISSPLARFVMQNIPTKRGKALRAGSKAIREVCARLIQEKREQTAREASKDATATPTTSSKDLLSVAVNSASLPPATLVDQMMTFLTAGHGTTSHALQWSVYSLCKHLDIQSRLREEVAYLVEREMEGEEEEEEEEEGPTVTAAEIDSLPYLNAFVNEVLRFYPPIPSTVREPLQTTTLEGYKIPRGTKLVIPISIANKDTSQWGEDAGVFNPDRWLKPGCAHTGGALSSSSSLTFLTGPRSCIGAGFARAELACLVACLVGRFQMQLEDPNKELTLNLKGVGVAPEDGVRVRLTMV